MLFNVIPNFIYFINSSNFIYHNHVFTFRFGLGRVIYINTVDSFVVVIYLLQPVSRPLIIIFTDMAPSSSFQLVDILT